MFTKRLHDIQVALPKTRLVLSPASMDAAAKKTMNAKRIVIWGLGNSAAFAHDAQHKFLRVGLNATAFDAIYTYIVTIKNSDALEAILGTKTALKEKRYSLAKLDCGIKYLIIF